jgi:hypothetical protein
MVFQCFPNVSKCFQLRTGQGASESYCFTQLQRDTPLTVTPSSGHPAEATATIRMEVPVQDA